jgi:IclR family KDG regulon transcriptional repressor
VDGTQAGCPAACRTKSHIDEQVARCLTEGPASEEEGLRLYNAWEGDISNGVPMRRMTPALSRGIDILELFLSNPRQRSMAQIVEETSLPRTTVHELVGTLVNRRFLDRNPDGQVALGIRVFQLGWVYREQLDLAREANAVALDIASHCEENVNVAVLEDLDVVYIATVESSHSVRLFSAVGRRLPAHATALGKALLAQLTNEALEIRYQNRRELPILTPQTLSSFGSLKAQLETVRASGVAIEHREANDAVACVAAPIQDATGNAVAAISISVPILRWSAEREQEFKRLVRLGARELSSRLGCPETADEEQAEGVDAAAERRADPLASP